MINYWCKWAIAIYGWKYLWSWMNFTLSKTINGILSTSKSNESAFIEYLGISKDDIIKVKWESSLYCPAYIVALDNETKNIVIAVRGTMGICDIITDVNVKNIDFYGGKVHGGINRAATNVYNEIKGHLIELMNNEDYKCYGFRFVGHSLGAAIVGIMTHMIFADYESMKSKTKTYCFGCPPIFSENIADRWANQILTIINNKDVIPRLCVGEKLYLPGIIMQYVKSNNGNTLVGRDKEYFVADNIVSSSFSEHFPNRYIEITKNL